MPRIRTIFLIVLMLRPIKFFDDLFDAAGILTLDQIEELSRGWNTEHCQPPLDDREFNKQWKCSLDFITKHSNANTPPGSDTASSSQEQQNVFLAISSKPSIGTLLLLNLKMS